MKWWDLGIKKNTDNIWASLSILPFQNPEPHRGHLSQFSSVSQWCLILRDPWTAKRQASLSITNSWSLLKLMSIELVMPSNHLILCHPLLLPSIFPSIRVFSNGSALHIRWPKYWTSSISPPMNIQGWFSLGWTGLISLHSKGLSRVFSSTTVQKHQFFGPQSPLRKLIYDKLIFPPCKLC